MVCVIGLRIRCRKAWSEGRSAGVCVVWLGSDQVDICEVLRVGVHGTEIDLRSAGFRHRPTVKSKSMILSGWPLRLCLVPSRSRTTSSRRGVSKCAPTQCIVNLGWTSARYRIQSYNTLAAGQLEWRCNLRFCNLLSVETRCLPFWVTRILARVSSGVVLCPNRGSACSGGWKKIRVSLGGARGPEEEPSLIGAVATYSYDGGRSRAEGPSGALLSVTMVQVVRMK